MNLFSQILNQAKLGEQGQFSGGIFGSINTQDFQSKAPTIQKSVQAEQNLINKGFSPKEVKFLKLQKDKGVDMNKAFSFVEQKRQEAQNPDLGVMSTVSEGTKGLFTAPQQLPRQAGNILDLTQKYITTPLLAGGAEMLGNEELGTRIRSAGAKFGELAKTSGEQTTRQAEDVFGTLTENQRNVRRTVGDIATTAPIPLGGVPKIIQGAKIAPTIARGAYYGAVGTPLYTGVSEGRLPTAPEMAMGTLGGAVAGPLLEKVAIPAVAGIASKTGKYGEALIKGGIQGAKKSIARDISAIKTPGVETITRNIPKAVVRRDLGFTPTERAKIEKITGKDEGTYILSKGLAGKGKEELAEVFMKQSDDMYNGITKNLSKVDAKVQSPIAKEALLDIMEQLESSPKIARAYAKDIEGVKNMLARDEFTLSELNNIRRAYDKVNTGMFTVQGKARSGLENAIDVKVRQDLSNQLQNEAKKYGVDVKAMNTELRAGLEMKDALLRRLSQEEKNNFIGLQDLGVSAILSGGNPVSAVATIAAKKYAEKIAPGLAQKAYNLNKAPNVTRNVSRGNTITNRNKSSQLGLASNSSTPVVSDVVKPIPKKVVTKLTPKEQNDIKLAEKGPMSIPLEVSNPALARKVASKEVMPKKITPTEKVKSPTKTTVNLQQSKGGFIKIPEIGKKVEPLIEEAKKYKSAQQFYDNITSGAGKIELANDLYEIPSKYQYLIPELKKIFIGLQKEKTVNIKDLKFAEHTKVSNSLPDLYKELGKTTTEGRKISEPIKITDGIVIDGHHRLAQAYRNGEKTIQAIETPDFYKAIEELYSKATKPKSIPVKNPLVEEANKILPINNAVETINNSIPNNIRQGWFLNGDKNYKKQLSDIISSDKKIRNSGLRVMYQNYLNTGGNLPFKDFLYTPIEMYRGSTSGKFNNDIFSSYSLDRKVAEKFSTKKFGEKINPNNIDTIKVKPIDTLGSYQTTGESEVLVKTK